jgi:dihydrofolate synthase / folylpolyglutamate synthase
MISQNSVVEYSSQIFDCIEKNKLQITFFEVVTMMAFLYFRDQNVDVAVLECGLGGRLDSTNICKSKVCAITSIGYDHCEILGYTLENICNEKAGIIRHEVQVVIGPTVPKEIVEAKCGETKSTLHQVLNENYR